VDEIWGQYKNVSGKNNLLFSTLFIIKAVGVNAHGRQDELTKGAPMVESLRLTYPNPVQERDRFVGCSVHIVKNLPMDPDAVPLPIWFVPSDKDVICGWYV
jgi:hypothetical protein